MSLSEDLAALPKGGRASNQCSVCHTFADAPFEDQLAVRNAIASGAPATALSAALRRNGYHVSADALRRHSKNGHVL